MPKPLIGYDAVSKPTAPNPLTHFVLAAALALLGLLEEAKAAAKAGLALDPSFTIRRYRRGAPSDNPDYLASRERGCAWSGYQRVDGEFCELPAWAQRRRKHSGALVKHEASRPCTEHRLGPSVFPRSLSITSRMRSAVL